VKKQGNEGEHKWDKNGEKMERLERLQKNHAGAHGRNVHEITSFDDSYTRNIL